MESAYGVNSTSMWRSLRADSTKVLFEDPDFTVFLLAESNAVRVIIRRPVRHLPGEVENLLDGFSRCYVEDPFGHLLLRNSSAFSREPLPTMYRKPSGAVDMPPKAIRVRVATSMEQVVSAERIIVDGYPIRSRQPFTPGCVFPDDLVDQENFRVWISYIEEEPVCACFSHDDGHYVGFYWLATLPWARSKGAAGVLFRTLVNTYAERYQVLTSTDAGRPLYESVGFKDGGQGVLLAKRP